MQYLLYPGFYTKWAKGGFWPPSPVSWCPQKVWYGISAPLCWFRSQNAPQLQILNDTLVHVRWDWQQILCLLFSVLLKIKESHFLNTSSVQLRRVLVIFRFWYTTGVLTWQCNTIIQHCKIFVICQWKINYFRRMIQKWYCKKMPNSFFLMLAYQ